MKCRRRNFLLEEEDPQNYSHQRGERSKWETSLSRDEKTKCRVKVLNQNDQKEGTDAEGTALRGGTIGGVERESRNIPQAYLAKTGEPTTCGKTDRG